MGVACSILTWLDLRYRPHPFAYIDGTRSLRELPREAIHHCRDASQ